MVRHRWLGRATTAAGLLACSLLGAPAFAQSPGPAPGPETTAVPVEILQARKAGDLAVTVRGAGDDRVKFTLKNTSPRRLNVVLPPGLVAASVGQGFQSMGLGTPTSSRGSFGQFRSGTGVDIASTTSATLASRDAGVVVPAGQTVEFHLPSVCLNFGIATPTPRDQFELMSVDDYSRDPRVRKALRSLATLGTSQKVAQAVMWHLCNGLSYEQLATEAAKFLNLHEITLAARFVNALDASGSALVDPSELTEARVLVRLSGDVYSKDLRRLASDLDGQRILGLPVRVVDDLPTSSDQLGSLSLKIHLSASKTGPTQGRVVVQHASIASGWVDLGRASFKPEGPVADLKAADLAAAVDRAVASTFVSARIARTAPGTTTLKIENRLPFTLANVVVRTGRTPEAGRVALSAVGIGPARSGLATIQAATGVVERVELNGL
jgi:hypothetical protein